MIIKKMLTVIGLLSISTLAFSASLIVNSDIKPIPVSFIGKWAGLHSTDQKLDKQVLRDLCENGGDSDTAYFVEFLEGGLQIQTLVWWVTLSNEYPLSFSHYSADHIAGQSAKSYATASENESEINSFNFKISDGKLYDGYGDDIIELMRCDEDIEINYPMSMHI